MAAEAAEIRAAGAVAAAATKGKSGDFARLSPANPNLGPNNGVGEIRENVRTLPHI